MMAGYKRLGEVTLEDVAAAGLPADEAARVHEELGRVLIETGGCSAPRAAEETWRRLSRRVLSPEQPFALHKMIFYGCYRDYGSDTPPAWIPDMEDAISTNIGRVLQRRGKEFLGSRYKDPISSFREFQEFSVSNPEVYWNVVLEEMKVFFSMQPTCILQAHSSYPGGKWLPGAVLNAAGNCLNLNDKRGLNDMAIIWRDEGSDDLPVNQMTLKELRSEVCTVAKALKTMGLSKGSSIAINMPMTVNSVVIYLAIVTAGFVVVSIADSFAAAEISTRLKISKAKAIFTQDYILRGGKNIPLYSRVIQADAPSAIVIPTRGFSFTVELRSGDLPWHDFLGRAKISKVDEYAAMELPVEALTNILFSSGTTGEPKAIPWTHATPLKAAADAWAHMDIHKGDVISWPTNLGWMMGPWLVYASLLNGATMALYNGSPLGAGFAKFVQDAKVTMLGVVPSIVRSWKNTNSTSGFDWSTIRCFSSTGEASNVDEYLWLMGRAYYKPVIEYCGGTEIGGGFVSGSFLQSQSLSAFSTPAMGCMLFILDVDGYPLPRGTPGIGELALYPTMFGASMELLNADHRNVYFSGMPVWNGKLLRRHGDEFELTPTAYYRAHGRADDTMNLGGIKVSSIEIERMCNEVDSDVLETAAIGVPPSGGGPEQLVVAVVFKDHKNLGEEKLSQLKVAFNASIQKKLNPLFRVSSVVAMTSLPRTASNKVMRRLLRQQFSHDNNGAKL